MRGQARGSCSGLVSTALRTRLAADLPQRRRSDPASLTPNSNLVEYTGWDLRKGNHRLSVVCLGNRYIGGYLRAPLWLPCLSKHGVGTAVPVFSSTCGNY